MKCHRSGIVAAVLCAASFTGCEIVGGEDNDDEPEFELVVTERSATTLRLQWPIMPDAVQAAYTVDYFDGFTTCEFPPTHGDVLRVNGNAVQLTGLTPATAYNIHVHSLPARATSTNVILVSTLPAGATATAATKANYMSC